MSPGEATVRALKAAAEADAASLNPPSYGVYLDNPPADPGWPIEQPWVTIREVSTAEALESIGCKSSAGRVRLTATATGSSPAQARAVADRVQDLVTPEALNPHGVWIVAISAQRLAPDTDEANRLTSVVIDISATSEIEP